MATYDDYLKELKRIVNEKEKEYIIPLENKIKPLSAELINLQQETDKLLKNLDDLRNEHNELMQQQKREEQAREATAERRRQEEDQAKKKKKQIFWARIYGIIGGLTTIGMLIFVSRNPNAFKGIGDFIVIAVMFFCSSSYTLFSVNLTIEKKVKDFADGCGSIIASAIIGAIFGAIMGAIVYVIGIASIAIGVCVGAYIGFSINKPD